MKVTEPRSQFICVEVARKLFMIWISRVAWTLLRPNLKSRLLYIESLILLAPWDVSRLGLRVFLILMKVIPVMKVTALEVRRKLSHLTHLFDSDGSADSPEVQKAPAASTAKPTRSGRQPILRFRQYWWTLNTFSNFLNINPSFLCFIFSSIGAL